ncbi:hypothetical protein C8R44DRAFT_46346 [Mycena epipterygia]|nr:hypothetical protein C8R44DRAFT_46346 [Mycena epipterygia]
MTLMHPSAIWLYLAQFFPRDVLASLMTADRVTRAILEQRVDETLDEQYRELDFRFLHLADGTAGRLRMRAVADRVRVLKIGPYFVCDALDSKDPPFRDAAQPIRRILARFRNVEEYHILWHERPTMSTVRRIETQYDHLFDTLPLASATLAVPFSSAPYLRSLTVELSLDKAEHLFFPTSVLPNLGEMKLCIRDDHAGDLDAAGYIMVHHLSRFLNNTHRTLHSLSFETSLNIDYSPLFSALGFFAHLSKLSLSIPTSDPHLGDPSALKGFLHSHHDTLEHLSLRGFCTSKVRAAMDSHWLSECLSDITFSSLHTLDVGTSFIPLDVVMLCIQQCTDTLTALDIAGDYLSFDAVEEILFALTDSPLKSLTAGVTCLCPELVDILAEHLPALTKLNLKIRYVTSHRDESPMFVGSSRTQKQSQVERFAAAMSGRNYDGWKLKDLGIWKFTSKLQYQALCVNILRDSLGQV